MEINYSSDSEVHEIHSLSNLTARDRIQGHNSFVFCCITFFWYK